MLPVELWNRFASGDHSCFRELFEGYYKGLYGYGLKLCSDAWLVEDCIQDLFVSLWERRHALQHISSANVYLYVSLRRNILKSGRDRQRVDRIHSMDPDEFPIRFELEELIFREESRRELKAELHQALNRLTNQQKEVLYLHFYNGMSYREIEQILSIRPQSVRNCVYRAMQTLRGTLSREVMRLVIM